MIYTFHLECTTNFANETDEDTPAQTNENYYCGSVNITSIEPSDEEIVDKEKKVKKGTKIHLNGLEILPKRIESRV